MRNQPGKKKAKASPGAAAGSRRHLPPPPAPEPRAIALRWWPAVILTCWSFGFTTMQGSDLWWHLAGGHWLAEAHTLHFRDPFSFTCHGHAWFHPEWLSDVIFHTWAKLFGEAALVWWKWGVLVAAFALLFRLLRQLSGHSAVAYLAMLAAMAVGAPFFDIRPQLYTVLGYVVVLALALPLSRRLWLLPVVFLLWANLHSGILLGLATVATVLVIATVTGELPRRAGVIGLLCLLACLVNGNGTQALLWPIRFALNDGSPFLRVAEWLPPYEPGGIRSNLYYPSIVLFVASLVVVTVSGAYRAQRRLTLTNAALGLATLVMSLRSRRFIPLFAISQSLLLAPAFGLVWSSLWRRMLGRWPWLERPRVWHIALPAVATLFGALRLAPYPLSGKAFLYLTAQDSFPVEAMNFVEANRIEGKVFNLYNWGGYIDLRSNGRLQVFIDGRAGTVFDEKTYRQYLRVTGMGRGWEDVVLDSGADFVLWPQRNPKQLEALRGSHRWRTLYSDHVAALLVRTDYTLPSPLLPTPDSPWRDLALGWSAAREREYLLAESHFQRALQRMPNLRLACEWLAHSRAKLNRLAEAERTLDHCQHMFPDAERHRQLLDLFRGRASASNAAPP